MRNFENFDLYALEQAVEQIFTLMQEVGFSQGKFFRFQEMSDCEDCFGVLRQLYPSPYNEDNFYPFFNKDDAYLNSYSYHGMPSGLLYTIHPPPHTQPKEPGVRFWKNIPPHDSQAWRVDLPVIRTVAHHVYKPVAFFLFEWAPAPVPVFFTFPRSGSQG